jgi:hypothetical protein
VALEDGFFLYGQAPEEYVAQAFKLIERFEMRRTFSKLEKKFAQCRGLENGTDGKQALHGARGAEVGRTKGVAGA